MNFEAAAYLDLVSSAVQLVVEVMLLVMVSVVSVVDDDRMKDAAIVVVGRLSRVQTGTRRAVLLLLLQRDGRLDDFG